MIHKPDNLFSAIFSSISFGLRDVSILQIQFLMKMSVHRFLLLFSLVKTRVSSTFHSTIFIANLD